MIPRIPPQRQFKSNDSKPFDDLVAYIEGGNATEPTLREGLCSVFDDILSYAISPLDLDTRQEKCLAIRTHGVAGIATASVEMNAVAKKNFRCEDPAYHVILSWPEYEHPAAELIFDAAEHAIKALGLAEHQYVLAVHGNTDNTHCHISVNRVHPVTFKSRHIEWAVKTLHLAARQSEIKHGWTHDNGIFIVEMDGHGKKHIVLNNDIGYASEKSGKRAQRELGSEPILPTWHDPDSLDSWLKTKVARALRKELPELTGWPALHAWLSRYDITLTDSGGGGMRLHAISAETGEVLDVAASKGLRMLKRSELESRWGKFFDIEPIPSICVDLSHLTPQQIAHGLEEVLNGTLEHAAPPEHIIRAHPFMGRDTSERDAGQPELAAAVSRDSRRDDIKRAQRREQRAAARADLRQRFSQYKRLVSAGDTDHFTHAKAIREERSQALKQIREQTKAAIAGIPKGTSLPNRLITIYAINTESLNRKLLVEASFQEKSRALLAIRTPPLSWRAWLHQQAGLGDQAALSALRGIVYQAQRDAKGDKAAQAQEVEVGTAESEEQQYQKTLARLLEEEKKEAAIRSADSSSMRPFEIDALLIRYQGIQWRVTGNGNVEYRDQGGGHLFTDRGNRITFDRARVSDDEIRLALAHAQQKFGQRLTLTGDDPVFTARMARLAIEMGMTILNPDLQALTAKNRVERKIPVHVATPPLAESAPVTLDKPEMLPSWSQDPVPLPEEKEPAPLAEESKDAPQSSVAMKSAEQLREVIVCNDDDATGAISNAAATEPPRIESVAATPADRSARHSLDTVAPVAQVPSVQMHPIATEAVAAGVPAVDSLTAAQWISLGHKRATMPYPKGDAAVAFSVVHIAPDGVVVDHGRAVAIYPIPKGLALQAGDRVFVDRNGELGLSSTPEQGGGKNVPGR